MPSAQTSLAALLLLLALVSEASAKGEKITFDRAVFSDGPSYRTNLCAIAQKVQAGEVQIKDALMGLNISVITPSDGPGDLHFSRNDNGTIADGSYPGMIARVLDELAERAGFR
ncbi:hypothetical protein T484DRAFT_1851294 [Baffinella frigidus]|nr:hypothetical protein T484DRAFT_1851294 [Cryptophyta sp. CCMP2293]